MAQVRSDKLFSGTNAKRLGIDTTNINPGDSFLEDTGSLYEWSGAEWKAKSSGGAAHTMDGFKPSSYTGRISSDEDGTTFAIATGARRLLLQSLEVNGLEEYAILAFGTSAANAQANLALTGTTPNILSNAGVIIRSGDSTAGGVAKDLLVGIPENAWGENGGYAAIGNGVAGLVQIVMVTQGV